MVTAGVVYGQAMKDVIYLKNGSIAKGVIVEQTIGESVKLQTTDGNQFVYNINEIEKFDKETTISSVSQIPVAIKRFKVAFDLTAGTGMSWLSGFNDATGLEGSLKLSYLVGMGLTVPINDTWGFETGGYYLLRGGNSYTYSDDESYENGNIDLDYILIPLLARFDFSKNQNVRNANTFGLKSGFQIGLNTNASVNGTSTYGTSSDSYFEYIDVNTNFDWVLGIYSCVGHSGVSLNFNLGLNDVLKSPLNNKNFRNASIVGLYSYRF